MNPARFNEVAFEEAMQMAAELYDFKLCQRGDGSYYGIDDGAQCRKGTETNRNDKEATREEVMKDTGNFGLTKRKLDTATKQLNDLNDEEFARVTNFAVDTMQKPAEPKSGMYNQKQGEALLKREKELMDLYNDSSVLEKKAKPVSDKELDAAFTLMSTEAKNHLLPGDVAKRMKQNDPEGYDKTEISKGLLKKWMELDGKDPYTGLPVKFFETELEHIKPIAVLGQKKADKLSNFTWIDRDVNQVKSNLPMREFLDKRVKAYTPEQMAQRKLESKAGSAARDVLRTSAKEDVKNVAAQSEHLIKKYGPNGVKYLARELGFRDSISGRDRVGRARSSPIFGNVQTAGSGKRGERIENTFIRGQAKWSESDKKKAQELYFEHVNRMRDESMGKGQSLQLLQNELEKLG